MNLNPIKLDDLLHYRFLSRLNFSPDGSCAAFVLSQANKAHDGYDQSLWLYEQGGVRRLTGGTAEGSYLWEDAHTLLFPACRTESERKGREQGDPATHFYRIDIRGGEAVHAFTVPYAVSALYPLGDGRFAATGPIDEHEPDAYLLDEEGRIARAKRLREQSDYVVAEEIPFWYNGMGDCSKSRTALFVFDPAGGPSRRLSAPNANVGSVAVQNGVVYFTCEEIAGQKRTQTSDIYRWDGRRAQRVWRNKKGWMLYGVQAAFGGIAAVATDCVGYGNHKNPYFYLLDEQSKSLTLLAENGDGLGAGLAGDCSYGSSRAFKGTADALYFTKTVGGAAILCAINRKGKLRTLCAQEGEVCDFDVADSGEILLVGLYGPRLQELYRLENGKPVRLSALNEEILAGKYVAACEPLSVQSRGWRIDGWVLKPRGFDPKKRYPAILDIHGGPKGAYGPIFVHEMQLWASRGHFVFYCNPFGGEGRGNDFADLRGKYGTIDYDNLMDFTDAVLAAYPQIDDKRLAVTGGSYGGFMTNWIVGHTDRFAVAATQRSITNWVSFCGTSDIGPTFGVDQNDAPMVEGAKKMWDASPLKYAANVKTPLLFIHSDEDYRCPLEQALQLFSYLCDKGVPTRMVRFKGENHELSRSGKPKHRVRRLQEITDWIERYTKK